MTHMLNTATIRKARKLNRVGSQAQNTTSPSELETIGQRMTARRLELKLTQKQVADQVMFTRKTGRRRHTQSTLSRNAYAMYEIGESEPDLQKIEGIARALKVSAGWLAFGGSDASSNNCKNIVPDALAEPTQLALKVMVTIKIELLGELCGLSRVLQTAIGASRDIFSA